MAPVNKELDRLISSSEISISISTSMSILAPQSNLFSANSYSGASFLPVTKYCINKMALILLASSLNSLAPTKFNLLKYLPKNGHNNISPALAMYIDSGGSPSGIGGISFFTGFSTRLSLANFWISFIICICLDETFFTFSITRDNNTLGWILFFSTYIENNLKVIGVVSGWSFDILLQINNIPFRVSVSFLNPSLRLIFSPDTASIDFSSKKKWSTSSGWINETIERIVCIFNKSNNLFIFWGDFDQKWSLKRRALGEFLIILAIIISQSMGTFLMDSMGIEPYVR